MSQGLFELSFLNAFLANPLRIAAPLPSGPALAKAIAAQVDPAAPGTVLELGPGSGPVTAALLARGVDPARLVAIESNTDFCALLRRRFPAITVVEGDAFHFDRLAPMPLSAIVSGLPVLVLRADERRAFLDACLARLPAGAPFVQFSYSVTPPIPPGTDVSVERRVVWANLPPMHVWRYVRGSSRPA